MGSIHEKYLLAVSGGVDSVVLLDYMMKKDCKVAVAHFDHGVRPESKKDASFVKSLTEKYSVQFFHKREDLGKDVSEETARDRRYKFLRTIAKENSLRLATAHHLDDMIETVVINLMRGTGWRGLTPLNAEDIERPLINYQKHDLLEYAKKNKLIWREDATNQSNAYTRNIVRHKLSLSEDAKRQLQILYQDQIRLSKEIDTEVTTLLGKITDNYEISRYFINNIDQASAFEIIRRLTRGELMPSQIDMAINAIKTQRKGTVFEASKKVNLWFDTRFFKIKMIK